MELRREHPRRARSRRSGRSHRFEMKLVNPANKRKYQRDRGRLRPRRRRPPRPRWPSSATTSTCFCYQDSPRRAHSIAAQGGINAAKNYQNDGDSVYRLFYDTVKGGDFRAREANVYRLAEVSREHHRPVRRPGRARSRASTAACSPTARSAARRSRAPSTPAARPASSSCSAPTRRWSARSGSARSTMYPRHEMLELVVVDGRARGIVTRDMVTGADRVARSPTPWCWRPAATATSSTSRPTPRAATPPRSGAPTRRARPSRNPCYTQIHPTCIPVTGDYQSKLTLMSESLRNDGRIWVPKKKGDTRPPDQIPEDERDYYLERKYPSFGNLAPRDIASRAAKQVCDEGRGVGAERPRRLPRLRRRHQAAGRARDRREVRQPVRHVRAHHRREPLPGADADLPGHATTRWAGCGWTTT